MKSKTLTQLLLTIGIVAVAGPARAQHGHLDVGATGTNQNDQLIWANGADFLDSSGYVKTLIHTNSARYSNYFQGGITLTALAATEAHSGPDPDAPAPGSFIQFSIDCLSGPAGGLFNFWESTGATPALSLAPGESSTNLWRLTESDGASGGDPYGHIHGRRFTATKPGIYKIGFTAHDTSTNGAGGGPIHRPSARIPVSFQAGVNILRIEPDGDHTHIRFGALAGATWQVEAAGTFGTNAVWSPVGAPVVGDDTFYEVEDETPVAGVRFYRVRQIAP